ncbi:unnamed protein product (macronuclear) [Paramecium tetraurelia]|uniref:Protein kinase domain-containing protein n=1 Tax=Paramecium tetraurelia TaxID=5888 RepID=A0CWX4_PARTE|nr:uncharacterized protein GSPATT00001494001 [Paramecium tetraurelia]CAK75291.1 unnamed protein product [Paramecium tetraurelia]|eukprot:XP_001442688.1 hypothetical protein (macronuclear) [Paramecium tetraurelia strain d4-2]
MNNSENQSQQSEQTQTIDYSQYLNGDRSQNTDYASLLERTIFQLLKKYPDVFTYNQHQVYDGKSAGANYILENGLLLGNGAYGSVYSTVNPKNNQPAALKVQINCNYDQVIMQAEEFKVQKQISIQFPECIIQIQNKIFISQKYMNTYRLYAYLDLGLGNLKEYQIQLKKFTEDQFNNLFDCILDSILKIHSLKIVHNDIKLENIINTQKNGWVLADFGCAIQYATPYGEYPIVGTRAYMQKQVRKALNNNLKKFKMNLFNKDIYAFQLTMLQILYPEDNINDLQQILDQQKLVHPKINSLYNKDYLTIKSQFLQQKFIRTAVIQEPILSTEYLKMKLEKNFKLSCQYKAYRDLQDLPYSKDMNYWTQCMMNLANQSDYREQEFLKKTMILDSFVDKYTFQYSAQEIFEEISFEDLSKFEYDLYYDVLEKRGQRMLQLMLCQGYQAVLNTPNCSLKFQEAELLYIIGEWEQAKEAINSIQNEMELENDEMLLKFICLKARLNGQWINIREEIIPYFLYYKDIHQILMEWKYILIDSIWQDQSKCIFNRLYDRKNNIFFDDLNTFKNSNQQEPFNFDFFKYIKVFDFCPENFFSSQDTLIKLMQKRNYDKYTIFYQGWISCEIMSYHDEYLVFIEEFIQFIEQNLEGYYFNWIIYDYYSRFLIYKGQFSKAKLYFYKAIKIVEKDCIYNQFTLFHHLFSLQIQEDNLESVETFSKNIDLLKQMPNSQITLYLFVWLMLEIIHLCEKQYSFRLANFFNQAINILKAQLVGHTLGLRIIYAIEQDLASQKKDFDAFQSATWQYLPDLIEALNEDYEEEVLNSFQQIYKLIEHQNLRLEDETKHTSRWLQSTIVFQSIGFKIHKFDNHFVAAVPCFYSRSCRRQGNERKLQEAQEIFKFTLMNHSWLFF